MACNAFLAGNSEVNLELQCFTAELITHIVCECNAPEWQNNRLKATRNRAGDTFLYHFWKLAASIPTTSCRVGLANYDEAC